MTDSRFLNFHLGEDVDILRNAVWEFSAREIAPLAQDIDHNTNFKNF